MRLFLSICLFFSLFIIQAQVSSEDSLFHQANEFAKQKNYLKSKEIALQLVKKNPRNQDYSQLLARIYYWNQENSEALQVLNEIWDEKSIDEELWNLKIALEIAVNHHNEVVNLTESAKNNFPDKKHYYTLKKAIALEQLNQDSQSLQELSNILADAKEFNDAQYLKTIILKKQKNHLSVGHLTTIFDNPNFKAQHLTHVEYGRKLGNHNWIARANHGNFFDKQSIQLESDAYVKFQNKYYLYLNAGVNLGNYVFPDYRFGVEGYKDFSRIGTSVGLRHLNFSTTSVWMYTGHLAYNFKQYTISYRPFLVENQSNWLISHLAYLRRNFESKESFIQLDLQYGTLPYYFFTTDLFNRLSAYRVGVNTKFRLNDNYFIQPIVMYEWEEYFVNQFHNRFNFQVILTTRF